MSHLRAPARRHLGAAVLCTAALALTLSAPATASAAAKPVSPPPAHAGFDYQIGGAYTPPAGVKVVSRDHEASPAPGLYNICYINAFQAQPSATGEWDADLLLRDSAGKVVYDKQWGEAMLDVRTDAKRRRIADKVGGWIDQCATKGFQAVEPDNYDSYTRSGKLINATQAQEFIKLLSARAHNDGLAIAQKNTVDLAPARRANGLDFAITEECGRYDECDQYTAAFGDAVIVIEYSAEGMKKACSAFGDELSIVRRDVDVAPAGSSGYVRKTC
ncbi:endo alpha-1,4 polygalactosaminidase [Streptomyces sp. NPDC047017]|uniref:endo alpha-1,4 polygalactosaminidase n=1 Tax=Streptomyces sp. NPDC047017 TaxID=3155024 RepID=UPI0033E1E684